MSRLPAPALRHGEVYVDGHNLLYQLYPGLMRDDPERGRQRFERTLGERSRWTLFYDGGPGGAARQTRRHGFAYRLFRRGRGR